MNFEQWWLIVVPLSFALGWIAARVDIRQLLTESRSLPRSYFRGLNFLLAEQPDRAIDAFIEVVKLDPETTELHFALGNLFRRRGEIERAVRMHQNLLSRTDLPPEQRSHAVFELAQDYLKAGLLDRAEESFLQLTDTPYALDAKRNLLDIFQIEKEWGKAIAMAQELQQSGAGSYQVNIAQFHCELAQQAMTRCELTQAQQHIEHALASNRKSVRALIALGDIAHQQGNDERAIVTWSRIAQQSPSHLALIVDRVLDAYTRLERLPEAIRLLRVWQNEQASIDILAALFRVVLQVEGAQAAYTVVRDELHRNPSLLGLDQFLSAQLQITPPEARNDLELVRNLVHNRTRHMARYTCTHCGFKARQFYWQCPGCSQWETYPPLRTEELEITR